jgi:hypothetical protein
MFYKVQIFFKKYWSELLAFIAAVFLTVVAFLFLFSPYNFIISVIIIICSTFFQIYFKSKEKNFYYYSFDRPGQEQDWIGRGILRFVKTDKCFEITESDVGFILPKTLNWDDYCYKLEFKITNTSLGFIVRAVNLSNSVMFQIMEDKIKPHIRINGNWVWMDVEKFNQKLNLDNWYKLEAACEKRQVRIRISDNKGETLFDRHKPIPLDLKVNIPQDLEGKKIETQYIQNIDLDFGAIGVRNFGNERALIRNIFVEKL